MLCRLLTALLAIPAFAAPPVSYEVRFPNAAHHEAEITATFPKVSQDVLAVLMSRSSPGRYALHGFAKNVYRLRAFDGAGKPLPVTRPHPHEWDVCGHDGTVRVTYCRRRSFGHAVLRSARSGFVFTRRRARDGKLPRS